MEKDSFDPEDVEAAAPEDLGVVYQTPCGRSLRNYDDVASFLVDTGSHHVLQVRPTLKKGEVPRRETVEAFSTSALLQVDFFTYNPSVQLDPAPAAGRRWPELDLSHGVEPTPVELCLGDGGARPPPFRYRKDRWPHGCFLSRSPALFSACCNCADGCVERCSCVAMAREGRHYRHQRLEEPVPAGVYECGPWCGCDRARCQNRLVQRGIRVRLQVFQTASCGWGVRCRDDLDRGTFVCTYAGATSAAPTPAQTTAGAPRAGVCRPNGCQMEKKNPKTLKRVFTETDVSILDASKEGNVGRFFNVRSFCKFPSVADVWYGVGLFSPEHSCRPNLFVQNVFTDSHDPAFPLVAFFTSSPSQHYCCKLHSSWLLIALSRLASLAKRAKAFWEKEDIDDVFDRIFKYLNHLKRVLKKNTATDKEYLQGQKLLEALDCSGSGPSQKASVVQVVIGSGELLVAKDTSSSSPPACPLTPPGEYSCAGPLLTERSFCPLWYRSSCSSDPTTAARSHTHTHRNTHTHTHTHTHLSNSARPPSLPPGLPDCSPQRASVGAAVLGSEPLKVPLLCGFQRLLLPEDLGVVYRRPAAGASVTMTTWRPSWWTRGATTSCSVYECGPWCGCDRARCQNRLVQRGIRVRLQVFQTASCGWGVRCRDDLDRGTFVCTYARVQSPAGPPSPKLPRTDLPSDDEVQVVTEWLVPAPEEAPSAATDGASPPLHVPVIQRPADAKTPQDRDKEGSPGGRQPAACPGATSAAPTPAQTTAGAPRAGVCRPNGCQMEKKNPKTLKRVFTETDVSILDASKEGNVGRFFNHSCRPNLFVQNVFTDSHDPAFPLVAFFTSSVVKAGTELTWDYSSAAGQTQEVPCLCGGRVCRGHFPIEEKPCELCAAEEEA
ncbi:unnamed protein product [Tetraodon nigroviridis]|uniref:(spotted green pufferfish) hypothetical protein n=1 Tax=Tetraodon nigroviridis TaxID=99883 RepID=Q4SU97_TETNG|nr:unnamed protein product [Tetraodon nigroviridis]